MQVKDITDEPDGSALITLEVSQEELLSLAKAGVIALLRDWVLENE